MKRTLPVVCIATALNVGLWLWSPPTIGSRQPTDNFRAVQRSERPATAAAQCPASSPAVPVHAAGRSDIPATEKTADQAWLNTVKDSVMQLSLSPRFADKVVLTKADCAGSKCQIEGSTKQGPNGQWYDSSDIASLMSTMSDGQIAGGDSGRIALLNSIKRSRDASEFSMTVEAQEGPPPRNPCQSVMDQWKSMHPEDFTENDPFKAKG